MRLPLLLILFFSFSLGACPASCTTSGSTCNCGCPTIPTSIVCPSGYTCQFSCSADNLDLLCQGKCSLQCAKNNCKNSNFNCTGYKGDTCTADCRQDNGVTCSGLSVDCSAETCTLIGNTGSSPNVDFNCYGSTCTFLSASGINCEVTPSLPACKCVSTVPQATLLNPTDFAVLAPLANGVASRSVNFGWNISFLQWKCTVASMTVSFGLLAGLPTSNAPGQILVLCTSSTSYTTSTSVTPGRYSWTVTYSNQASQTSVASGQFCLPQSLGAAPNQLIPANGASAGTNPTFGFTFPLANLGFSCVNEARSVVFQLSPTSSFGTITTFYQIDLNNNYPPGGVVTFSSVPNLPTTGTYYWRILASQNATTSVSSAVYTISFCAAVAPIAGTLIPLSGYIPSGASVSWTAPVTWGVACPSNFNTFTVRLQVLGSGTWTDFAAGLSQSTLSVPLTGVAEGDYSWQVIASNGDQTAAYAPAQIKVCNSVPPTPGSLTFPTNGASLSTTSTTFTWTAANFGKSCVGGAFNTWLRVGPTIYGPYTTLSATIPTGAGSNVSVSVIYGNGETNTSTTPIRVTWCFPTAPTFTLAPLFWAASSTLLSFTASAWNSCGNTDSFIVRAGPTLGTQQLVQTLLSPPSINAVPYTITASGDVYWSVAFSGLATGTTAQSMFYGCYPLPAQPPASSTPTSVTPGPVTFSWSANIGEACNNSVTYQFFVNTTLAYSGPLTTASYTIPAGNTSWSVVVRNGGLAPVWSNFSILASTNCVPVRPTVPALSAPADTSVVNSNTATFSWSSSNFGVSCGFQTNFYLLTYSIRSGTPVVINQTGTSFVLNSLSDSDTVSWFVIASNSNETIQSPTWQFSVCRETSPATPSASLVNPVTIQSSFSFSVQWTTSGGKVCSGSPISNFTVRVFSGGVSVATYNFATSPTVVTVSTVGNYSLYVEQLLGNYVVPSNVVSIRICVDSPPGSASGFSPDGVILVDPPQLDLAWADSDPGLTCPANRRRNVPGLTYDVYFGPQGSLALVANGIQNNFYTINGPIAPGSYGWQVVTNKGSLVSNTSVVLFTVCATRPASGLAVTQPLNGSAFTSGGGAIPLRWSFADVGETCQACSPCPSAEVYLGTSPSTWSVLTTVPLSTLNFDYTAPANGRYFWQVVVQGYNLSTPIYEFDVCTPSPPVVVNPDFLSTPAEGEIVRASFVLTWDPSGLDLTGVCGGISYNIYLGKNPLALSFFGRTLSGALPTYSLSLANGTYYWQVEPVGGSTPAISRSVIRSVNVCKPNTPISASITSPQRGAFITQPDDDPGQSLNVTFVFTGSPDFGYVCPTFAIEPAAYTIVIGQVVGSGALANVTLLRNITAINTPKDASSVYRVSVPVTDLPQPLTYPFSWSVTTWNAAGLFSQSSDRTFLACSNSRPSKPQLNSPINNPRPQLTTLVVSWLPIGFGEVCSSSVVNRQVTVQRRFTGQTDADWTDVLFYPQTALSGLFVGLETNTSYDWRIRADNGVFNDVSLVRTFRTRLYVCGDNWNCLNGGNCTDAPDTPAEASNNPTCVCPPAWDGTYCDVPVCPEGCVNGNCTLNGDGEPQCSCEAGYSGSDCSLALSAADTLSLAIAIPVVFVLLLVAVGVLIFLIRRKKKSERLLLDIEEPDFDELAILPVKLSPRATPYNASNPAWQELEDLLLEDGYLVAQALNAALGNAGPESDTYAKACVYFFESHGVGLEYMTVTAEKECQRQEAEVLFRGNTHFTKMYKTWSRLYGIEWLWRTLGEMMAYLLNEYKKKTEIQQELANADEKDFGSVMNFQVDAEINPDEVGNNVNLTLNALHVKLSAQRLFSRLVKKAPTFPFKLVEVLRVIHKLLKIHGINEEQEKVVFSGFIFLRFLNPALVAPEAHGLAPEEEGLENVKAARRELVLISKIFQNLSNRLEFGAKEGFMTKFNSFIAANTETLDRFLFHDVLECEPTEFNRYNTTIPPEVVHDCLSSILLNLQSKPGDVAAFLEEHNAALVPRLEAIVGRLSATPPRFVSSRALKPQNSQANIESAVELQPLNTAGEAEGSHSEEDF